MALPSRCLVQKNDSITRHILVLLFLSIYLHLDTSSGLAHPMNHVSSHVICKHLHYTIGLFFTYLTYPSLCRSTSFLTALIHLMKLRKSTLPCFSISRSPTLVGVTDPLQLNELHSLTFPQVLCAIQRNTHPNLFHRYLFKF